MATPETRTLARLGATIVVAASVAAVAWMTVPPAGRTDGQGHGSSVAAHRLIDVNAAGAEELALLPGVGPAIAGRIVSDRADRGPFASIDELRRVKGIGAATLERIRPFATAGQSA